LIQAAWDASNVARVVELLEATRPGQDEDDLRGFEWHYFHRLCHADLRTSKFGERLEFSPDGTRCAGVVSEGDKPGTGRRVVKVWDLATGKEFRSWSLAKPDSSVLTLSLSRDGTRLAALTVMGKPTLKATADYKVAVWDVATGNELLTLEGAFDGQ